jgi:hypothetical protein
MASIKLKDYLESLNSKGSISNNDLLPLLDSDSSNALKKITKGNLTNLESITGWSTFSSSVANSSNTTSQDTIGLGSYTASLKGAIEVSGQNVNVLGMITAQQFNVTYVSSSVQFKSGSTEFGDSIDDTHTITGTIILNGSVLELSQLNNFSSSIRNEINGIEAYTSSLKSKLIVSSSTQIQNYDVFALNSNLYTATGSLFGITNGLMAWTASLDNTFATDAQLLPILQATRSLELLSGSMIDITNGLMAYTASNQTWRSGIRAEIDGIEAWTSSIDSIYASDAQLLPILQATRSLEILSGSMIGITNGLMAYTASNQTWRSGIRAEIDGIEAWTSSLDSIYASDSQLLPVYQATASLNTFSGSLIGITNGLMAFTAALDSTYATDAQLLQLYQATRSLEILSGSLIGITNGLMAFTAGLDSTYATDAQLLPILQATASINLTTGSLIGITNGLMAFTAALDSTYATDTQLLELYQATASINLTTGSLIGITNGLMAFTAALDSTYATDAQLLPILQATASLNTFTGSIQSEVSGIEAYTASLKGAAIVSSSQQITNYYKFAETASANTFYGNQNISGSLTVNSTGASGISINSSNDNPTLNFTQLAQANSSARNWRFVSNYEAWGTIDLQVSNDHTTLPSTLTRVSITGGGDVNLKTGNLIFANGKGIDFSATANSGSTVTSEILDDYEVGTWTPTDGTGAGLTFTTVFGRYVKIGKQVTVHFRVNYPSTADATAAIIGGLPYVVDSGNNYMGGVVHWTDASMVLTLMAIDTTSTLSVRRNADNTDPTNANLSTKILRGTVTYQTF